jgi:hypothetical protein
VRADIAAECENLSGKGGIMKAWRYLWTLVVAVIVSCTGVADVHAVTMGTAFTYQGRFTNNGVPASGSYDFRFKLYDAQSLGNQQGTTCDVGGVTVTDGYFTVELDFGTSVFAGEARWLEIATKQGGTDYTTLSPRHKLNPGPYAVYSDKTRGITVSSTGKVGIGSGVDPQNDLTVKGTIEAQGANGETGFFFTHTTGHYMSLRSFVSGATPLPIKLQQYYSGSPQDRLVIDNSGNGYVGIGTSSPTRKLDVNGRVQATGYDTSSDEQLKTDVKPLEGVLDKLQNVRAVSFRWNEKARSLGANPGTKQIGVLAQEVEQAFPELVTTPTPITLDELLKNYSADELTPETKQRLQDDVERTHYKSVSYSELTAVLLEAVKELRAENKALEQRIQALEKKGQ